MTFKELIEDKKLQNKMRALALKYKLDYEDMRSLLFLRLVKYKFMDKIVEGPTTKGLLLLMFKRVCFSQLKLKARRIPEFANPEEGEEVDISAHLEGPKRVFRRQGYKNFRRYLRDSGVKFQMKGYIRFLDNMCIRISPKIGVHITRIEVPRDLRYQVLPVTMDTVVQLVARSFTVREVSDIFGLKYQTLRNGIARVEGERPYEQ